MVHYMFSGFYGASTILSYLCLASISCNLHEPSEHASEFLGYPDRLSLLYSCDRFHSHIPPAEDYLQGASCSDLESH
jgi:hypothetical protein